MSSPHIQKGALTVSGKRSDSIKPVVFQFNPETIRRIQNYSESDNNLSESIRFELVLSAMEVLEQEASEIFEYGIYPQLAALEELLQYQTQVRRRSWLDWLFGSNDDRFLAWVYGERVIPVKIHRMTIREVLHNHRLQPIHATMDIALRVQTARDLRGNAAGLAALSAYKQYRQTKAELTESQV
jgi:hypothetical protein